MESILVALITGLCAVAAMWLQTRGTRRDLKQVKDNSVKTHEEAAATKAAVHSVQTQVRRIDTQVTNSHTENFRDEVTRGFAEIHERLDDQHQAHSADIKGLRFQVASVQNRLSNHIDNGGDE